MTEGKILAKVAGEVITDIDVDRMIASMGQRGAAYNTPSGRSALLDEIVNKKLLLLDARRNLIEREPAFKEQLEKLKEELLANYCVEKVISDVRVTAEETKKFFDEHESDFVAGERVEASHILTDSEEKAQSILGDIKDGKISFEEAAKQFSTCPSKENGGSLGEFSRGQMVPEFEEVAFGMNEGEISDPVKTQFGYHIIRLEKKHPAEKMNYADISEHIKAKLLQEKQQKAFRSKINQLKIMYPVDKF